MTTTSKTRYPKLTRAILRHLDQDQLKDVCRHGANTGWNGFTYSSDCKSFFRRHRADIMSMLQETASELGEDMLTMIAGFNCLKDSKLTPDEIARGIYTGKGECVDMIIDSLAWFALETVANELVGEEA